MFKKTESIVTALIFDGSTLLIHSLSYTERLHLENV
jgi:hypothetical protein